MTETVKEAKEVYLRKLNIEISAAWFKVKFA